MEEGRLKDIAVIGAAGKMGRGIALLLLQERALSNKPFILRLVDKNEGALLQTLKYLRLQLTRFAEKKIVRIRELYRSNSTLVSNQEVIHFFVTSALERVEWGKELAICSTSELIFEAIIEDVQLKVALFQSLEKLTRVSPFYFSNTSSIPIHTLAEKAKIDGRLIGYHFYNPPAVQKLLEIIPPSGVEPELITFANQLAIRLKKEVVISQDVAGFIGNGLFLREISFATAHAKTIEEIAQVDFVTEAFLLRPMGIFSLVDYVGIDVVCRIAVIMRSFLSIDLPLGFIDRLQSHGIFGGQNPDGSRKEGIFSYEKGVAVAVFDFKAGKYVPFEQEWIKALGDLPEGHASWKSLTKDVSREEKIKHYFQNLDRTDTLGANLAKKFLNHSQKISDELVQAAVAESIEDVETVLKEGFYHLVGLKVLV